MKPKEALNSVQRISHIDEANKILESLDISDDLPDFPQFETIPFTAQEEKAEIKKMQHDIGDNIQGVSQKFRFSYLWALTYYVRYLLK